MYSSAFPHLAGSMLLSPSMLCILHPSPSLFSTHAIVNATRLPSMLCYAMFMQRHQSTLCRKTFKKKRFLQDQNPLRPQKKERCIIRLYTLLSYTRRTQTLPPPGQRPRHAHHDLAFAETPEVNAHADYIIDAGVRALVQQQRRQAAQWVDEQSGFYAPVHRG